MSVVSILALMSPADAPLRSRPRTLSMPRLPVSQGRPGHSVGGSEIDTPVDPEVAKKREIIRLHQVLSPRPSSPLAVFTPPNPPPVSLHCVPKCL